MNFLHLLLLSLFSIEAYASLNQDYKECVICTREKIPENFYRLKCGDDLCKDCIRHIASESLDNWDDLHLFRCPFCRYLIKEEDMANMPFCATEYQRFINLRTRRNQNVLRQTQLLSENNIDNQGNVYNRRTLQLPDNFSVSSPNSHNDTDEELQLIQILDMPAPAVPTNSSENNSSKNNNSGKPEPVEFDGGNTADYFDKNLFINFITVFSLYKLTSFTKKSPVYKRVAAWTSKKINSIKEKTKNALTKTKENVSQKVKKYPVTIIGSSISTIALSLYFYKYGFKQIPFLTKKVEECSICCAKFNIADFYKLGCACPRKIHNACLDRIIKSCDSFNYYRKTPTCPWCRYEITREEIGKFDETMSPEFQINKSYIANAIANIKNWIGLSLY